MIRRPPRSTHCISSAASDVYKRQVSTQSTWAYVVGNYLHRYIKPIQIKKHGNKAKSIFKHGLTYIASVLLNPNFQSDIDVFEFLSCTQCYGIYQKYYAQSRSGA
eukprot:TRINITY_DN34868_c0_g1_i2.p5 TRINITY_DN34868_c0_g1~~TRINITY_DN34868_c0_g1_i2.p5  ORF type:complete len:105 (+),score=19.85 TRINITY_DN34868_c0_g1_i2:149-463(+)